MANIVELKLTNGPHEGYNQDTDFVNTVVVMFLNLVLLVVTAKYAKRALDVGKNI